MAFQQIPHLQLENLAVQFNHDAQLHEEISTDNFEENVLLSLPV